VSKKSPVSIANLTGASDSADPEVQYPDVSLDTFYQVKLLRVYTDFGQ
jgi:hypothetical protein